jgi:hypothetical protein
MVAVARRDRDAILAVGSNLAVGSATLAVGSVASSVHHPEMSIRKSDR